MGSGTMEAGTIRSLRRLRERRGRSKPASERQLRKTIEAAHAAAAAAREMRFKHRQKHRLDRAQDIDEALDGLRRASAKLKPERNRAPYGIGAAGELEGELEAAARAVQHERRRLAKMQRR